ncbi:Alpha/beta hydrolase fold-3 [Penicillium occitanis (nom. inval.)]|nr:hypothetical protein PENOC_080340 [Penicillium occitanis (nom. inval.)]PCG95055.1 Alpha/beta hydrolase fold-3 [Penicillium occitanis (nom. inval.)]
MASREPRNSLTLFGKVDAVLGIFSMGMEFPSEEHLCLPRSLQLTNTLSFGGRLFYYFGRFSWYLFESSDQIYLKYCQSSQVKPNLVSTDQGVKGFWIGSPRAKFVGIFFHGGGFAMDGTKSHIDLCLELQRSLDQNGIELAWFYSTYTLMPHATYPTQFCEAVETLNYILHDLRRDPSEVILAGDSAGANLCLAILSHMTHPATGAPRLIVQEPLKAIALISPWVSFDHNWPSVRRNEHKDIEATDATALWSRIYLDVNPTNYYTEAARAPEEWWKEAKVQHTLVLAGEDEILLDPITAWVSNFQV